VAVSGAGDGQDVRGCRGVSHELLLRGKAGAGKPGGGDDRRLLNGGSGEEIGEGGGIRSVEGAMRRKKREGRARVGGALG
jgi:hypothetical protein